VSVLAVLDTDALFPIIRRGFLLTAADEGLFEPLWSRETLDELEAALIRDAGLDPKKAAESIAALAEHFPEARAVGYEQWLRTLTLPDPKDVHVLAATVHYEADVLVTLNLRHFPPAVLEPCGVRALTPDGFLCELSVADPVGMLEVGRSHRAMLTRSRPSTDDYLDSLRNNGLAGVADFLAPRL
jgi:predicted nucleic acid-binding protein